MERDRALGHQEPHWKEFRFDLTQIPAGEAVTAAEFRIYKLPSTHPLNQTLHVSMFEVVPEQSNRCRSPPRLCQSVGPSPGGTFPRGQKGSSPPSEKKDAWPQTSCYRGERPSITWLQVPSLLSCLWDGAQVTLLLSLSFPICTQAQ